jgi:8-oxo-dGTP pyrophosphatase MutT (NUDIX family)
MYSTDLRTRLDGALDPEPIHVPAQGDRLAAVLVPILDSGSILFTKRTEGLPRHPGEISFPGGIRQEDDVAAVNTALRETEEELGIAPDAVEILGALPAVHTFVSAILIVPFVGLLKDPPVLRPNPGEIAEVLSYPLDALLTAQTEVEWQLEGGIYRGHAYDMGTHTIWGATAHILHSLLELLGDGPE